ncbi:LysR family substrate-binding domain-containing protein [Microbacterium sp. Root180]|uniref:LysR family substrate-binding domain-containing protein n=1 Tax=Microbacterium sp. Root180 TaxID=1736483 RepID=UPI0006F6DBD3|nr:LysR family substrate-binding domain-containing protein [Microbacterium sp. Root180]KRB38465.1 transcriptional regulator [Microbacterium sp. Root180]
MTKGGGSHPRKGAKGRDAASGRPAGKRPSQGKTPPKSAAKRTPRPSPGPSPEPPAPPAERFVLGAIPGATPGKWIDLWNERMPRTALELIPLAVPDQRRALVEGAVDAALVRLPLDRTDLHVIALYDEIPVVVTAADSALTAADELDLADLAGEVVIVPHDDVLGLEVPGAVTPAFAPPADTAEAIATVAAGVGIVIVPMSLARLHRRKDADYRPLRDAPTSAVALAWVADRTTPEVEAFVGIVRGRTSNSSR